MAAGTQITENYPSKNNYSNLAKTKKAKSVPRTTNNSYIFKKSTNGGYCEPTQQGWVDVYE